jgi:hypothetical protein
VCKDIARKQKNQHEKERKKERKKEKKNTTPERPNDWMISEEKIYNSRHPAKGVFFFATHTLYRNDIYLSE